MILLDTNVVSELMRAQPNANLLHWLREQRADQLYLTALTVAEIRRGLALLPKGKRRIKLEVAFEEFLKQGFRDRILPFTAETSLVYAPIYHARIQSGLGVGELDLLIAAIAKEYQASLATRNTSDFKACGIKLINPWL
ncbi:MAG: type II toxin-antitoxin system VapC family toxin [Puniceicoccaceae bacterium]|nr:MAG: type II toxin-antitoxin system VapC family toxin [Puniceicoccaceae bacterium]